MNEQILNVSRETFFRRLSGGLSPLGVELSLSGSNTLFDFWQEVLRWNRTHNLTTITDIEKAIENHFLDSMLPASEQAVFSSFKKVMDLGTGAGFPGVPLSVLFPATDYHLLDKSHKKISFLHLVSGTLNLKNVYPVLGTMSLHNEKYDAIVSRAVKVDDEIFSYCKKLINPGGYLIVYYSSNQLPYPSSYLSLTRKFDINGASRVVSFYQF